MLLSSDFLLLLRCTQHLCGLYWTKTSHASKIPWPSNLKGFCWRRVLSSCLSRLHRKGLQSWTIPLKNQQFCTASIFNALQTCTFASSVIYHLSVNLPTLIPGNLGHRSSKVWCWTSNRGCSNDRFTGWHGRTYQPLSWFGFGQFHGYPKAYPHKTDRRGGIELCLFLILGWEVGRCKLLCIKAPFWTNQGQERIKDKKGSKHGALVGSKYQESAGLQSLLSDGALCLRTKTEEFLHVKAPPAPLWKR